MVQASRSRRVRLAGAAGRKNNTEMGKVTPSKKSKVAVSTGIAVAVGLATAAFAQSPPGPPPDLNLIYSPGDWPIKTLREGKVYLVPGGGSNSTVIVGDKGVIVVDVKTTMATGEQLLKKIATITPKPVTHVIESHSDCDHINGIVAFPKSTNVIAHVINRTEQEQVARLATVEINGGYGVAPQDRLPDVLITKDKETTTIDGVRLAFYHYGPGHTGGDLMVYLPDQKIMVAGDILFTSDISSPNSGLFFKFEKGATTAGWFANAEALLKVDAEFYVTGHGDKLLTKADVKKVVADFRAQMAKVDALAASGKTLEETTKAMGDRPFDPLANTLRPNTMKECPRGTIAMSASWIRWHEWTNEHKGLKSLVAGK
jgi:glyoxylase-like metal-dependent hydrolase (beta-lactamase superfamily II)